MIATHAEIRERLRAALVGTTVHRPALGVGSIVLLDFVGADPSDTAKYLRIETVWRLELGPNNVVTSEDDRPRLRQALEALAECHVESIDVADTSPDLRIGLSNGATLVAFVLSSDVTEFDDWTVGIGDDRHVIAGPGQRLRLVRNEE